MLRVNALIALVIGAITVLSEPALAQRASAFCYREAAQVACDVRTDYIKSQIQDVTATVGGKPADRVYESYDRGLRKTVYYMLIQQSLHPKDAASIIERIVARPGQGRDYGVATFTDRLEQKAAIGATQTEINKIRGDVSKKADAPSALYAAANEAMTKLTALSADRRALVLFADGRVTNYDSRDRELLIKTARERNVLVYTVFMGAKDAKGAEPRTMLDLRSDTNGISLEAGCPDKSACTNVDLSTDAVKTLVNDFHLYAERGGILKVTSSVPRGADVTVEVKFTDGTTARVDRVEVKDGQFAPGPTPPLSWYDAPLAWLKDNILMAAAGGGALLGLLIMGVALLSRRGGRANDDEDFPGTQRAGANGPGGTMVMPGDAGVTQILTPGIDVSPPVQVYAWLQFLDSDSRRIPIGSTNVRIGRGKDNEIILSNKTVHRQHAVIKRSPEGRFSIHHLGGENIVKVNNQQAYQLELNDNDMIELGEVRMRFFANA